MYHRRYISEEFTSYLNRYCTGIMLLKDKIEKITVSFYLSEAYSNHSCRFSIDVEFPDYSKLAEEDKRVVNQYFYNSVNSSGSQFVSFIYKSQKDYHLNVNEIKSFIQHYEFARYIFEGFVRNIIPEKCILTVDSLESEPFYNYFDSFLSKYECQNEIQSFSRRYAEITKRSFDFDRHYHKVLADTAVKDLDSETISDNELNSAGGGKIEDIRRFVVEEKIPFSFPSYLKVIDRIDIDIQALEEKIGNYIPKKSFIDIRPKSILSVLKKKREDAEKQKVILEQKCSEMSIKIGDYVYVGSTFVNDNQKMGVVEEIRMSYNSELEIKYIVLKNDLSKSRLPLKEVKSSEIMYILSFEIFDSETNKGVLKTKNQLIRLLKSQGIKNALFNKKKK